MPFWPFKKKRRKTSKDDISQPLTESEKIQPVQQPTRAATYPSAEPTKPIPIPRKSSKRGSQRKRRASHDESEKQLEALEKENVPPPSGYTGSKEDITALPMSRRLENSPHLRPVDMERPPIPYNFRQYSTSQTSVQREDGVASPRRPNTLKKRRSNYDSGTPQRRRSSRKRKDDHLREEEIRAMSAQAPIPKRPGEGPLRRDSKKMRSISMKESAVSLPQEDSIHSPIDEVVEQHGWEIGSIDVFNPRPAVRLSGTPQYVTPGSLPTLDPSSPERPLLKEKERVPPSRDSNRKRDTIGNRADDLDASDLRMLLERDAKRREKRKKEQQEKLDRKLRGRSGRNRGDSDRKKREAEEARKLEEAKQLAEEERRARELMTPPTEIHPALRNTGEERDQGAVGLGIAERETTAGADVSGDQRRGDVSTTKQQQEDPFADPEPEQVPTPVSDKVQALPGAFSPIQTPMEDPVLETAREVRMSQASTPPLSPIQTGSAAVGVSQLMDSRRTSELSPPPPITKEPRRASDPKPERRAGTWAAFFRRGGQNSKKGDEARSPPSETSFSNVSRESMRNRPLPAHLVETQEQPTSQSQVRRKSGPPVRTQSRFREDLPELPMSPPDSRMPSPDVTTAAAAAANARRAQRSATPIDVPKQNSGREFGRNDTPVSPSLHGPGVLSSSLASVDSEGSWLASGSAKRHSTQSALSRRKPEFNASYEELGGDTDPQHFSRGTPTPDTKQGSLDPKIGSSALPAPTEEVTEATFGDPEQDMSPQQTPLDSPDDPMTVHESVRRKPTLVHRDPRVKSREGLLAEFQGDVETPVPTSAGTGKGSMDLDSDPDAPEPDVQRATSVDYGKRHARQVSAGSAKLLDVRRPSQDIRRDSGEPPTTPSAKM